MRNENNTTQNLIEFAEKIGKMEQGLKGLDSHFTNHLSDHKLDRVMQWVVIALQTIVIIGLGIVMFK